MTNNLFTIGYASFSITDFISTLQQHNITALVDVRSAPYSKYKPEFKKDNLNKVLTENSISYIFLGKYVGVRVEDPECYIDEKLNYVFINPYINYASIYIAKVQININSLSSLSNKVITTTRDFEV